jgi:hypothetical protein
LVSVSSAIRIAREKQDYRRGAKDAEKNTLNAKNKLTAKTQRARGNDSAEHDLCASKEAVPLQGLAVQYNIHPELMMLSSVIYFASSAPLG